MEGSRLALILAMSLHSVLTLSALDSAEHDPIATSQNNQLNVLLPETRKPYIDPHAIKPNLDESMAPTNVHTNSEYLQGQKMTDTNPNQNRANQIKSERPIRTSGTGKKI